MTVIDTTSLPVFEKRPGWHGSLFHSANMTFSQWRFEAGATIHEHFHPHEEVWQVLEGELEITVAGQAQAAGPGMALVVPPDTPHSVLALSDGRAHVVDFPLRTDFLPA